ncbi:PREDICTED: protein bicaudal C [Ceratosolen solmsi marchali]|uniref:Protein bicaudal C n=1 Tax=Ceratosolen solmsi marchali TaxID=326594 RepID=A0AAJ7E398_9HYME|nr:PREDICTED: protein bicaudal C [Ceratosolen solmsi marchali]
MRPNDLIQQERRITETMSETSEGTTTTTSVSGKSSIDNVEELRGLAAVLGIVNPDDLQQERFRVDRRKLEQMLLGDSSSESADMFFHKVMEETNTFITWPSRLKIGAKSKKDPHIKVAGLQENIRIAKDQITQVLDTRQNNRVTMKLDVSYTDHSHIIGKGGLTIKKVMEETSCHIHFPDSNRSNHQEKSNQVSIAGDMEGVEKARARVRTLTPLIFSFELPVMGNSSQIAVAASATPFSTSPYIVKIQEKYNVQVMFRTRPKLHATLVVVKGCEWEVSKVKEATVLLIHHMCENLASQIQVQMSMEISPQHHSVVLGKQSNNLKSIMQRTATQIMFPDAGDPNIPSLKKSNVTITGSIHNVYLARQQLMGSLPLVLMFDLPEKSINSVTTDDVSRLMQSLDVFINVRHKPKQSTLSIVVKGIERNASNIYEARRQLLGLEEVKVVADIPQTYLAPNSTSFILQGGSVPLGPFVINENIPNNGMSSPPSSFCSMSPSSGIHSASNSSVSFPAHWAITPMPPSLFSPISLHPNHLTPTYAYPPHLSHLLTMQQHQRQQQQQHQHTLHNTGKGLMGLDAQLHSSANNMNSALNGVFLNGMRNGLFSDSKDSSAFSSISSVSSSLSSPALSPRNVSPIDPTSVACSEVNANLDLSNVLSELTLASNARATGNEKKTTQLEMQSNLQDFTPMTFDYEQKKLMALKAMQTKPNANDYRVPTSVWSGYGFSQTIPHIASATETSNDTLCQTSSLWKDTPTPTALTQDYGVTSTKDETTNAKITGVTSNYIDNTSNYLLKKITSQHHTDLASMLTSVGLEKYVRLFLSHEVDMATFPSLVEKDLCEIGITAWGARRKIMLLISEMNKRTSPFSGSAAPGAERKFASLSSSSTSVTPPTPVRKCSLENNNW